MKRHKRRRTALTWAPKLRYDKRRKSTVRVDPLHYGELVWLARHARTSVNFAVDEILMAYFKSYSPRYGEEV